MNDCNIKEMLSILYQRLNKKKQALETNRSILNKYHFTFHFDLYIGV